MAVVVAVRYCGLDLAVCTAVVTFTHFKNTEGGVILHGNSVPLPKAGEVVAIDSSVIALMEW